MFHMTLGFQPRTTLGFNRTEHSVVATCPLGICATKAATVAAHGLSVRPEQPKKRSSFGAICSMLSSVFIWFSLGAQVMDMARRCVGKG